MTTPEFEALLARYENGTCTPEERIRLERWLDARHGGGTSAFADATERDTVEKLLLQRIRQSTNMRTTRTVPMWTAWRVAASLLLLVAASYGVWYYVASDIGVEATHIRASKPDAIEKVMLADGTLVWLKPGGRLTYPDRFTGNTREVSLEGEALFEVAKDAAHPFLIHCGELTTAVLGTSFNIRSTRERTEVFVLTGKVSVTSQPTRENVELLPRESVVYAHATRHLQKIGKQPEKQAEVYTRGTEYSMRFDNITIGEIARRIEGKFNVRMTLEGPLEGCMITADFTDQSLPNTLDIIAETVNATYTIEDDAVVLRGSGCQ
jgi:ferric-dicitrate binding protein FerR (iron transport regulator)